MLATCLRWSASARAHVHTRFPDLANGWADCVQIWCVARAGIGRIVIAGLQNPDCIPFWWIAPGFEIHSKKQDLIADWIASYFQFLQSNPDCNPFLGQLVMSDIFPILIGLE